MTVARTTRMTGLFAVLVTVVALAAPSFEAGATTSVSPTSTQRSTMAVATDASR